MVSKELQQAAQLKTGHSPTINPIDIAAPHGSPANSYRRRHRQHDS
jgi:hypothetical protein